MASSQVRLSTLAEIRVLSFESYRNFDNTGAPRGVTSILSSIDAFKQAVSNNNIKLDANKIVQQFFKTVGIARQIRIDEQYNTQNLYAIGSPTRPRIVPGNMSVSVTCERIQLDKRNLYDFMSTPEYFYAPQIQRATGILDAFYYTYVFVKNKEPGQGRIYEPAARYDIYAVMPVSSSKTVTNGDVMISHNVQLTGFKVNVGDSSLRALLSSVTDDITETLSNSTTYEPGQQDG
jgi:hypothetical protein